MELYKKLHEIQMAVRGLKKDKDGFGFKYVTGGKLLGFIKPLMDEKKILLKQEILSIDNERMDYTTEKGKSKNEILSKVMMKFTWIDTETGEKDENLFGANGQNDWDKGVGSALTYGERYFLLKYFHIATDEDDVDNPDRKPEEKQPEKPKEKAKLDAKGMEYLKSEKSRVKDFENALKFRDLTPQQRNDIENMLTVVNNGSQ